MQNDSVVSAADQDEEIFDFLHEVCWRYHLGRHSTNFNESEFISFVVLEAGRLYLKVATKPITGESVTLKQCRTILRRRRPFR
jgi:hypothetical protein